ncbi:hypothetical protein ACEPAI_8284 [Sanghuangporus weigelae]
MSSYENNICSLPHELLTEIFRIATDNPVRDIDSLVLWTPFEGSYAPQKLEESRIALKTKHALASVCRLFRDLTPEFLYEDIWIRYGSDGLREVLEDSKVWDADGEGFGFGRFTRRVSIYSAVELSDSSVPMPQNARAILSCCPNVRVISRSPIPQENLHTQVEFIDAIPSLNDLEFPHLQRVEWHNVPNDTMLAATPTPTPFFFSQSLRVLIIGPDNFPPARRSSASGLDENQEQEAPETVISLPNLHTLGIQSIDAFGEPLRRYSIYLPSLKHLILKRPEAIYNLFDGGLTPLAPQITSLELAADFRFLRHDFISTVLDYCSHAEELYIPVFATRAPHQNMIPRVLLEFSSVKRVYLHAGLPNGYVYGQQAWWTMLEAHFDGLCGPNSRFITLESIILSGREWIESVQDKDRFTVVLRMVRRKEVELVADDNNVQNELSLAFQELDYA